MSHPGDIHKDLKHISTCFLHVSGICSCQNPHRKILAAHQAAIAMETDRSCDQMTFNAKSNTPSPYVTEKDLTPPHAQSSVAYDSWGKDAKRQMKWKESAQRLKRKQKTWQQCVYLLSFDREQFAWLYTMAWASNQTQSTMFCLANINHSMREIYEMYLISDA